MPGNTASNEGGLWYQELYGWFRVLDLKSPSGKARTVTIEDPAAARSGSGREPLDPAEVIAFLRDLPSLWEAAPQSRRALTESLFERIDVLGLASMHVEPTPAAISRGLAEAISRGTHVYGRGERSRAEANQVLIPRLHGGETLVTMGGAPAPLRAVRSA